MHVPVLVPNSSTPSIRSQDVGFMQRLISTPQSCMGAYLCADSGTEDFCLQAKRQCRSLPSQRMGYAESAQTGGQQSLGTRLSKSTLLN